MATSRGTFVPYRLALFIIILLLILFMIRPSAHSARHAVLIGIQDYPDHIQALVGPVNDVNSIFLHLLTWHAVSGVLKLRKNQEPSLKSIPTKEELL